METRINKFICDSGYCSRREADKLVEFKRVTINGKVAQMGAKVAAGDVVRINGNLVENHNQRVYIALNKPKGIVCTTDKLERDNVVDYVNYPSRIFNIGRLDKDSEGLILLTNDGNIVNKILRASNNHEKEYDVMVDKPLTDEFIEGMGSGVPIMGTTTKKCKVEKVDTFRFKIVLTQGLNRQIRRMCEHFGFNVVNLRRVRVMNITTNKLPLGQWRVLEESEIEQITSMIQDSDGTEKASKGAGVPKHFKKGFWARPKGDGDAAAKPTKDAKSKRGAAKGSVKAGAKSKTGGKSAVKRSATAPRVNPNKRTTYQGKKR